MNSRLRAVILLAAALLLCGVLWWAWSGPPDAPMDPEPLRGAPAASAPIPSGVPAPASTAPSAPGPSVPPPGVEPGVASGGVDTGSGEPWPEPEGPHPLPQENDPIEPEKPQTAAWRHEKLVHISELLTRDVARLEGERESARARGDEEEARRLAVQLARHRARLGSLREETAAMAEAARREAQAE